jgi:hypothetical protein
MFQTSGAPGIELYEGFPFRGIAIDLSVRLARLAFTRSVPSAIPRGGPSLASRALISAEVRCRPGTEAPVPPVPPLSFVPLQGTYAPATDPVSRLLLPWDWSRAVGEPLARDAPYGVFITGGLGVARK